MHAGITNEDLVAALDSTLKLLKEVEREQRKRRSETVKESTARHRKKWKEAYAAIHKYKRKENPCTT